MFNLNIQEFQSRNALLEAQTCRKFIFFSEYKVDLNDSPLLKSDQKAILQQAVIDLGLSSLKRTTLSSAKQPPESQSNLIDIYLQQSGTPSKLLEQNNNKNDRKLIFSKGDKLWMYRCFSNIPQQLQDDQFKFYLKKVSPSLKIRWASAISNILRFKTNKSSKLRLLPGDILHKVIQYSVPSDHYIIENLQNRSRVELTSIQSGCIELKQNRQYFLRERKKERKKIKLRIQKIVLGSQNQDLSIIDHNTKASNIISSYIESVAWSSQKKLQKTIILNNLNLGQFKDFTEEKIDLLVFRLEIPDVFKKCFLVALRSSAEETINLVSLFTASRHINNKQFYGRVSHQNKKWVIRPNEDNANIDDKFWVSLRHNQQFIINKQKEYLIKFQRFPNLLKLQFREEQE